MKSDEAGFFDTDDRVPRPSMADGPPEWLRTVVEFGTLRAEFEPALPRALRSHGCRPPYAALPRVRILVQQALYTPADDQAENQLRDRLSVMRFVGLALPEPAHRRGR